MTRLLQILPLLLLLLLSGCANESPVSDYVAQIRIEMPESPEGDTTTARVTQVIDGDTIRVEISGNVYSVRYIGINTPERNQNGYAEATDINSELVLGQTVELEKDVSEVDQYGRLLRYVWVDGQMVNAVLVGLGYAESVVYRPDMLYADDFAEIESYARENGSGLWKYQWFGR